VAGMRIVTKIIDYLAFPYSMYLVVKNPAVSGRVKLKAGLILAAIFFYVWDPIDIIPDFIPVLGWVDDLMVIPLAMWVAGKVVPEISFTELRQKARAHTKKVLIWALVIFGIMILEGLSILGLLIYLAIRYWG